MVKLSNAFEMGEKIGGWEEERVVGEEAVARDGTVEKQTDTDVKKRETTRSIFSKQVEHD